MEPHDICTGCSKHVAYCMCCVSIGPEGVVRTRPNPITVAGVLRKLATDNRLKNKEVESNQTPIARCRWQALQAAKDGLYSTAVWLWEFHLSKEQVNSLAVELEKDGFKCEVYPDYDFIHLNWE